MEKRAVLVMLYRAGSALSRRIVNGNDTGEGQMNKSIHQLFENLDTWRHLPSYQLGRRADIIFWVYLPEYLKKKFGYDVQVVIPDFPIRVGTVRPVTDNNSSFKVDYFVKVSNPSMVILLKFMTESGSKRSEPDWYLTEAKKKGVRQLLSGLRKIVTGSTPRSRFDYLLRSLECAGLIQVTETNHFHILDAEHDISIMYIQPNATSDNNVVTFAELADFVSQKSDDLSQRFAQSLREWATGKKGAEDE
jgi:hypothetical protein